MQKTVELPQFSKFVVDIAVIMQQQVHERTLPHGVESREALDGSCSHGHSA